MLGLVWWGSWRVFLETAFSHRFASAAAPLLLPSRTRLAVPGSVNSFQMLSKIKDHDTRIFKSSSLFTCTLYLLNTLDFFSLYFIAQWHSWAILLSNFCVYPSYFVKFLPSFLSLPRPRGSVLGILCHFSWHTESLNGKAALCVFSVCVSQWWSGDSLQAAFSSCVNTAGKLRVDRGSCELFSFPLCVLECCSESLHNAPFMYMFKWRLRVGHYFALDVPEQQCLPLYNSSILITNMGFGPFPLLYIWCKGMYLAC